MRMTIKNLTLYVPIFIFCFFSYIKIVSAEISLLSSSLKGLSISYHPSLASVDTILYNNKTYVQFRYHNHTVRNHTGAPAIPSKTLFFAAPQGIIPSLKINYLSSSVRTDVIILPVPHLEEDNNGFQIEVYEEDPMSYALSGYKPRNFVELGTCVENGGISIWELVFTPVLYDARALSVAVADSFDVEVSFGTGIINTYTIATRIPQYIINKDLFKDMSIKKTTFITSDPFAKGDWYRIKLTQSGMYRISGAELAQAGFPVSAVQPQEIRMYYGGGHLLEKTPHEITTNDFREIAIKILNSGDSTFDKNDSIIFYGESLSRFIIKQNEIRPEFQNHLYSEENVYWLTISNEGIPLRMDPAGEAPISSIAATTSYRCLKHIEYENQLELVGGGTEWYWDAISSQTKTYAFSAPDVVPGKKSDIRIGFINQLNMKIHNLDIYVNNDSPHSYIFQGKEKGFIPVIFNGELSARDNMVHILRTQGSPTESIHLDYIEVEYEREMALINNNLEFFWTGDSAPVKFIVSKAPPSDIKIFDTTNPYQVKEYTFSQYDNQQKTITFQTTVPAGQTSRFTLWDNGSYQKVLSITKKSRSNLRQTSITANYIIITHNLFREEAERLAAWRSRDSSSDPLIPMVVDIADIYDEFNWGVLDPVSIRDFLKFVWENGNPALNYYCCIIGDTTYKYKNLTEFQAGKNLVPTFTDFNDYEVLTTDDFFGWFDSQKKCAFALGRLCAYDKETAGILVDKIIDYERNPEPGLWHNRILLIADDELRDNGLFKQETEHSRFIEEIDSGDFLPDSMERLKIMMIEYPMKNFLKPDVTEDMLTAFNDGYILADFVGHGNDELLAHEHILVGTRDIERFNNGGRQSVFFISSCRVANFIQLDNISLAEMLHLRKNGGCIAVIAATGETFGSMNVDLNKSFYSFLFNRGKNPEHRIGHALQLAKHDVDIDNSDYFIILGDPATRLMIPRYGFSVAQLDTIYRLQKLDLSGSIHDDSNPVPYNGTLYIKARGPKIQKKYSTENNLKTITYTQPGNIFYFGELDISGNDFNAALVVPKDLSSVGEKPVIYFFATGQDREASGALSGFSIGGLYNEAPDDREGPHIQLKFDGKNFNDGDYLSRQPTLQATITDPSGMNICGNRGHNITLLMDKTEIVILSDRFKALNGFSMGIIEYSLPILSPGEHLLEMNVYDTYNNASKKRVTAYVVGSVTGDISIMNLLNYPNPMDENGTTFTFSLTDEARHADIKIYSQSGRLVDSIKFPVGYGFNQIPWRPPFKIANGVYFYKLTVRSVNGRTSAKIEKLVVMK